MNFVLNGKSITLLFYFTTNNNIENLQLLTMIEHSKLHAKLRKERNDD